MINIILIDVDDTLLDFKKCAEYSMTQALGDIGHEMKAGYFETFTRQNDMLWHRIEKGELTVEELYKIRWNIIFEKLGIDYDGEAFEKSFLSYLKKSAIPVDGAHEALEYLHSKYRVCIASNAPYQQQLDRLSLAGMTQSLDDYFISGEIGAAKPDKKFYDYCMKALGSTNPQELLVIGDSLTSDIAGGLAAGMKTCWFNRKGIIPPDDVKPDYTIAALGELMSIF